MIVDGPLGAAGAALLVWTATPGTLLANAAAAIGPGIDYVLSRVPHDGALVVMADVLVDTVLGEGAERAAAIAGPVIRDVKEIVGFLASRPG